MFYINIFFIYSFLGFLFENLFTAIVGSNFNSGILYGPWTFIYGFAIFTLMYLNKIIDKLKTNKWFKIIIFFLASTVIMSIIEFTGGFLIEKLFHIVYWDYNNMKFNFGHYICLEAAIFWGIFATLVNYLLRPILEKIAKKIPKLVTFIFIILFVIDIVATIIN